MDISRKLIESEDGSNRKSDVKTVEGYISGIALGAASHGEQHEADYDDYKREQDGNKGDRVCDECGADYRGACHGEQSTEINRGNEIIDLDGIYVLCGLLNERAVECDLAQRQHEGCYREHRKDYPDYGELRAGKGRLEPVELLLKVGVLGLSGIRLIHKSLFSAVVNKIHAAAGAIGAPIKNCKTAAALRTFSHIFSSKH